MSKLIGYTAFYWILTNNKKTIASSVIPLSFKNDYKQHFGDKIPNEEDFLPWLEFMKTKTK